MKKKEAKTSRVAGVYWESDRQGWRVVIPDNGKNRYIGRYKDLNTAIEARMNADKGIYPTEENRKLILTDKMKRIRMRTVWREVLNLGPTDWTSFDHFLATVGERPSETPWVVAKDKNRPVGPDNYIWVAPKYDYKTKEGRRDYQRQHRKDNFLHYKDKDLRKKFDIPLAEYQKKFIEQGGVCAVCKKPETATRNGKARWLAVDHNHSTGQVRGLLCNNCNTALGKLQEDRTIILALVEYLDRYKNSEEDLPDNVVRMK